MRNFWIVLSAFITILLVACASPGEEDNEEADTDNNDEQVEVDKGLLNVEITLPPSMFEGEDIDVVISEAKENGVKEVTKNDDGSLTYKMSKATHREMMEELETSIGESIDEIVGNEDFPSIQDISHNNSYTEFTVEVEREAYENSFDGFAVLSLGMFGGYYQLYNGANADDYSVTIYTKDQDTGEIFGEVNYPEDLQEETEEETE